MRKCCRYIGCVVFAVVISASAARSQEQEHPQETQPDQQEQEQPQKPQPDQQQPQQPQQTQPDQNQPQQPLQPDQTQREQPIPAYKSPLASQADNGDTDANTPIQLLPDNSPLTGVQSLSLGVPRGRHSYWEPHAQFDLTVDTNPPETSRPGLTLWSSAAGGVDLYRYSGNSELIFQYLGGGTFSNNDNVGAGGVGGGGIGRVGVLQDANLTAQFTSRRWTLILLDQLRYSPENAFGGAGFAGISSPIGIGVGGGIGGIFGADQSILSAFGQRLTNTSVAQIDVLLSPRSSLTFVGAFTVLQFFDEALLNSTVASFQAGYNHKLNRTDSVGISYAFSAFRYINYAQAINVNRVFVSYDRRITGRLAFKISGGPEFAQFQTSISGSGVSGSGPTNELTWGLRAELLYALERTEIFANYRHGVGGGSGVLAGSIGDELGAGVSRQISRTLTGNLHVAFARNNGLAVQLQGFSSPASGVYDYLITGAQLTYKFNSSLHIFAIYGFQYQNSNTPFCSGTSCGRYYTRNLFTVGLAWRTRPKPF
jgi:hypothetical protein